MRSISTRLLTGTGLVLAIFVVLTAVSVSYSVHQRAETALFDRLQGLIYGILGATEIDEQAQLLVSDAELPDARLNSTSTGLHAEIIGNTGEKLWQSASSAVFVPAVVVNPVGEWVFERTASKSGHAVHHLYLTTVWELEDGEEFPFIIHVVTDAASLSNQLRRFDRTLWASLLVSAVCLLLVQLWVLSRSLVPLKTIGEELDAIEHGERDSLNETVPRELKPLARSINTLLVSERNRHRQYRDLLDDLAHSLKTPLSVLGNLNTSDTENPLPVIRAQTAQMQESVARYLQRSAMRTPQYLAPPISPLPVITRLNTTLSKLHKSGEVQIDTQVDETFKVRIADADLYEILGNVLENAYKYGASHISINSLLNADGKPEIIVADNGPGFPADTITHLTERGVRADTQVAGQGLGLAASQELLESYGGTLTLANADSGGARVTLTFP